jgi:Zn-dependent peptidase ImmA (M78 family)
MTPTRRKEIRDFAGRVYKATKCTLPVNVDMVVQRLGGTISERADLSAEAMILKSSETSFAINLRTGPPNRRKFSVAHEIGHLFLHMGYLVDKDRWSKVTTFVDSMERAGYSVQEFEAHEFAGSLLMPEADFRAIAAQHLTTGGYVLPPIAERFDVSVDAARTRGRWLGLFSWT